RKRGCSMSNILETPFDIPNEEGTSFDLIPAGRYPAEVVKVDSKPTKSGNGHAVHLTWSICEGEYEKRLLFQQILLQHTSAEAQKIGRQKFHDVAIACGINEAFTDLDLLLYKKCFVS